MTTNPYITNFANENEQDLGASLVQESIRFYGYDVQYAVRTNLNYDNVTNESTNVTFNTSFPMEMYIKSIDGYEGQGQFLSHIGIEIRNQVTFAVSMKSWSEQIQVVVTPEDILRPREGDLVYFALDNKLFEIKKVNRYSMFYQMGSLYTWDLTCELFEYSGETLATGFDPIDQIAIDISMNTNEKGSVVDGIPEFDTDFTFIDRLADNKHIDDSTTGWIDFTDDNAFSRKF